MTTPSTDLRTRVEGLVSRYEGWEEACRLEGDMGGVEALVAVVRDLRAALAAPDVTGAFAPVEGWVVLGVNARPLPYTFSTVEGIARTTASGFGFPVVPALLIPRPTKEGE